MIQKWLKYRPNAPEIHCTTCIYVGSSGARNGQSFPLRQASLVSFLQLLSSLFPFFFSSYSSYVLFVFTFSLQLPSVTSSPLFLTLFMAYYVFLSYFFLPFLLSLRTLPHFLHRFPLFLVVFTPFLVCLSVLLHTLPHSVHCFPPSLAVFNPSSPSSAFTLSSSYALILPLYISLPLFHFLRRPPFLPPFFLSTIPHL